MYDEGGNYVSGVSQEPGSSHVAKRKIAFKMLVQNRPAFSASKTRQLHLHVYIGQTCIGQCLPLPLYFYSGLRCDTPTNAVLDTFTDYDDYLRVSFRPQLFLSPDPMLYPKRMFPPSWDPEKHLLLGVHVAFVYHTTSRTIISRIKILK